MIALAVATVALALQEPEAPGWVGFWKEEGGNDALVVEEARIGWSEDGDVRFYRMRTEDDAWTLESRGRQRIVHVRVDGADLLELESAGERVRFVRTPNLPSVLRLDEYELPEPGEVSPEQVRDLQAEFRQHHEDDQRVRLAAMRPGVAPDELMRLQKEMRATDERLTARLLTLMAEHGWLDGARFGKDVANTAFLIVQHSGDLRLMQTALPYIETDVRARFLSGSSFALLYDRMRLAQGYPQRFGSQLSTLETGETVLMPCENLEEIDEYRSRLGMGPLVDYLRLFDSSGDVRTLEAAMKAPAAKQGEGR